MYPRIISVLFYMFFTCVIFNPEVQGLAIYFYVFIPFLDPDFSRFLASTARRWSGPLLIAVAVSLASSPTVAVKIVSIAICIGYLMYTMTRRINYLHHWMAINIIFAMLQFVLYYVDYPLSIQLGPEEMSKMIWGQYATPTFTNFFEIFYFARVSGFSREAGFFSSLLVGAFVAYLSTERVNKKMVALYCIGLFISFSKSSMLLFVIAGLYLFRHKLRAVHPLMILIIFVGVITPLAVFLANHGFYGSESFAHRFSGYPFLLDARLEDVILGVSPQKIVAQYTYLPYIHSIEHLVKIGVPFAGLPATVADLGLFGALVFIGVLAFTASDGFVMLLFLLLTCTVSITTVTSFVPIAYLLLYWPRFTVFWAQFTQETQERLSNGSNGSLSRFRRPETNRPIPIGSK